MFINSMFTSDSRPTPEQTQTLRISVKTNVLIKQIHYMFTQIMQAQIKQVRSSNFANVIGGALNYKVILINYE